MNGTDLDTLMDRIVRTSAGMDVAIHRLLTDVRVLDGEGGWSRDGASSCAAWLMWKCSMEGGEAREKVRVAKALGALPVMDEGLRTGQLSYSKVREMTRVATAENEARLCEMARGTTAAQLGRVCKLLKQVEPRDPLVEENRWLRTREVASGMVRVEAQLRPEEAARVVAACDVFAKKATERADALVTMAEATLRGDKPERPPVEVVLHVDAGTLHGNLDGTGVSAETSRRILCDAGVVPALESSDGTILDVGRKSRVFCGALRRALFVRARGRCEFPGCEHRRYLEGHHIRHWVDGGETSMTNAVLTCSFHHRCLHEGGFRVVATADGPRFFRPDGRPVQAGTVVPAAVGEVAELPPTWDGERIDYDAIFTYVSAEARGAHATGPGA